MALAYIGDESGSFNLKVISFRSDELDGKSINRALWIVPSRVAMAREPNLLKRERSIRVASWRLHTRNGVPVSTTAAVCIPLISTSTVSFGSSSGSKT